MQIMFSDYTGVRLEVSNRMIVGAGKAMLRGKFTQLKCSHLKWESYQTNNLRCYRKKLEKKSFQNETKTSKRKGIIEIRTQINQIENNFKTNREMQWNQNLVLWEY